MTQSFCESCSGTFFHGDLDNSNKPTKICKVKMKITVKAYFELNKDLVAPIPTNKTTKLNNVIPKRSLNFVMSLAVFMAP